MAKLIATVSTVIVRDKKRIHVGPGTKHPSYDFTKEEVEQINRIHPGALRKPVNETAVAEPDAETSPEKTLDATANQANKKPKKAKAAEADAQSGAATEDEKSEDGEGTDGAGEDDDI